MMLLRMTYPVLLGGLAGWVPVLVPGPLPPTGYWSLPDWYSPSGPWAPVPPAGPQTPAMVPMAGAGAGSPSAVLDPAAEPEGGTAGAETAGGTAGAETEMGRGPDQGAGEPRPVPRSPRCILVRISSAVPPRISHRSAGKMGTRLHKS